MIGQRIRTVFAEVFQIEPAQLEAGTSPQDLDAWDSFGHLALVEALQDALQITFELEDIAEMETLGRIEEIAVRRGARP
jgi:acyl carrier protein